MDSDRTRTATGWPGAEASKAQPRRRTACCGPAAVVASSRLPRTSPAPAVGPGTPTTRQPSVGLPPPVGPVLSAYTHTRDVPGRAGSSADQPVAPPYRRYTAPTSGRG